MERTTRVIAARVGDRDILALERLKECWGLTSDSSAVRFALRVAAALGTDIVHTLRLQPNPDEVEVEK